MERWARYLGREVQYRPDLPGIPVMVRDVVQFEPEQTPYDVARLVTHADAAGAIPRPTVVAYRFPYARSARGQVRYPVALREVIDAR